MMPTVKNYLERRNNKNYIKSKNLNYTIHKFIWFILFLHFKKTNNIKNKKNQL